MSAAAIATPKTNPKSSQRSMVPGYAASDRSSSLGVRRGRG